MNYNIQTVIKMLITIYKLFYNNYNFIGIGNYDDMQNCNPKVTFTYAFKHDDLQHLTWTHNCPSNCKCTHFSISLYNCIYKHWSAQNYSTDVNNTTMTFIGIAKIEICSHTKCYKSSRDNDYCTDGNAIYTTSNAGNVFIITLN